nr:MAG TPA: hypothetical protein [Caudoviricetes sp.]
MVYRPGHRIGAESLHNSSPSSHVLFNPRSHPRRPSSLFKGG